MRHGNELATEWLYTLIADDKARDAYRNDARMRASVDAIVHAVGDGRDPRFAIRHVLTELCAELRRRDRAAIEKRVVDCWKLPIPTKDTP